MPWAALPVGVVLALLFARQPDFGGLLHDGGVYLAMAREIAAGHGPVDGHLPPATRTARFPPLHPLLLAAEGELLAARGPGFEGVHRLVAVNALWVALALFLFLRWLIVRRGWPPALALAAGLVAFTLPSVLGHAQLLMSESIFTALLMLALVAVDALGSRPALRGLLAAGALSGLLAATRTVGVVLAAAAMLHVARRTRAWRAAAAFAGAAFLPFALAQLWSRSSAAVDPALAGSPLLGPPYLSLLPVGAAALARVVAMNVAKFGDELLRVVLPQLPENYAGTTGGFALRAGAIALLAALAVVALLLRRRRAPTATPWLLGVYGLALLPWPFADSRLVVPVAPLALAWIGEGAAALAGPFCRTRPRLAAGAGGAVLVALAVWNAPAIAALFRTRPGTAPLFAESRPVGDLESAGAWLAQSTAPAEVFAATLDPTLHFLAGRSGVSSWVNDDPVSEFYAGRGGRWRQLFFGLPDRDVLAHMFERAGEVVAEYDRLGVTHVVWMRAGGHPIHEALVAALIHSPTPYASRFSREFVSDDGGLEIWRVLPPAR